MIVLDASAVLEAVAAEVVNKALIERLLCEGDDLHAPELVDVEVIGGLRRLEAKAEITAERAVAARRQIALLALERYPHQGLVDRAWELRHALTAYDATYVALSEALGAPLVTCDGRLSRSSGHRASIELYQRPS